MATTKDDLDELKQVALSLANTVKMNVESNQRLFQKILDTKKTLLFKPEPFTGIPADGITSFSRDFTKFAIYNELTDDQKSQMLSFFLKDRALIYYETLSQDVKNNLNNSLESLKKHFLPESSLHLRRSTLYSLTMKNFSNDIEKYYCHVLVQYPLLKMTENEALQIFINGLTIPLREHCILAQPKSLSAAFDQAQLKYHSMQSIGQNAPLLSLQEPLGKMQNQIDLLNEKFDRIANNFQPVRQRPFKRPIICNFCGKLNHVARSCYRKYPHLKPFRNSNRYSEITKNPLKSKSFTSKPSSLELDISVFDRKFTMLIDTGASVSCVSPKIFEYFPELRDSLTSPDKSILTGASDNPIKVEGLLPLPIKLNDVANFEFPFHVANVSVDFIAGCDLLKHLNATINVSDESITMNGVDFPLKDGYNSSDISLLRTTNFQGAPLHQNPKINEKLCKETVSSRSMPYGTIGSSIFRIFSNFDCNVWPMVYFLCFVCCMLMHSQIFQGPLLECQSKVFVKNLYSLDEEVQKTELQRFNFSSEFHQFALNNLSHSFHFRFLIGVTSHFFNVLQTLQSSTESVLIPCYFHTFYFCWKRLLTGNCFIFRVFSMLIHIMRFHFFQLHFILHAFI